jgi:hypothetical protein
MDGYTLAAQLRRTRRRYRLSAASQALYYELVAIANEEGWPDTFKCPNSELSSSLSISENTLILARQELIQSDLINYKSGKGRKACNVYSFHINKSLKNCGISMGINQVFTEVLSDDLIKLKEKPKQKVVVVTDYVSAFEFFKSTKNKRLLMEKHALSDEELEWYFLVFYDSKVDLGDLNGKTIADIARNFYYWLPKHLAAQSVSKTYDVKRTTLNGTPTRGVAAAMQFTDVQMRE